jgi:hypothetical protein
LNGPVEELCYHVQGAVKSKDERPRTVASYKADINCDSIIMRLNCYNFGSLMKTIWETEVIPLRTEVMSLWI